MEFFERAEGPLSPPNRYFVFCATALFSGCSQLWEGKNRKSFSLFSATCQLWELWQILGQGGYALEELQRVEPLANRVHRILADAILAYHGSDVKRKNVGGRGCAARVSILPETGITSRLAPGFPRRFSS